MNVESRCETPEDRHAIWTVNRSAFEADAEATLVGALRDGGYVEVSLVAEMDGQIIGHILFSREAIITKGGDVEALSLAPMKGSLSSVEDSQARMKINCVPASHAGRIDVI